MQFIPSHMPSVNGQFEHEDVSEGATSEYIMKALMLTAKKIVSTLQPFKANTSFFLIIAYMRY